MAATAANTEEAYFELHRRLRGRMGDARSIPSYAGINPARYERINEIYKLVRCIDSLPRASRTELGRIMNNHLAIVQVPEETWMILVGTPVVNGRSVVSEGVATLSVLDVR
jgi:hypothetical protein